MTSAMNLHSVSIVSSCALAVVALACSEGQPKGDEPQGEATTGGAASTATGGSVAGSGGDTAGSGGSTGGGHFQDDGESWFLFDEERGARVRFTTYEAEFMETNGELLGPTREFGQVASEASGRQAVRLDAEGDFVSLVNAKASNSVVVRYSIPDRGGDYWTKLTVLVDGEERVKLDVTRAIRGATGMKTTISSIVRLKMIQVPVPLITFLTRRVL